MSGTTAPFPFTQSTFMQGIAVASNTAATLNNAASVPLAVPVFSETNLPPAAVNLGSLIRVTNYTATVLYPLATSDGTNWRWLQTGVIVS